MTTAWRDQQLQDTADNSQLLDEGAGNQALTADDILAMQQDGKSAEDIVAGLVANSTTFQSKTQFSQEKYRNKKTQKHSTLVRVQRPSAASICEVGAAQAAAPVIRRLPSLQAAEAHTLVTLCDLQLRFSAKQGCSAGKCLHGWWRACSQVWQVSAVGSSRHVWGTGSHIHGSSHAPPGAADGPCSGQSSGSCQWQTSRDLALVLTRLICLAAVLQQGAGQGGACQGGHPRPPAQLGQHRRPCKGGRRHCSMICCTAHGPRPARRGLGRCWLPLLRVALSPPLRHPCTPPCCFLKRVWQWLSHKQTSKQSWPTLQVCILKACTGMIVGSVAPPCCLLKRLGIGCHKQTSKQSWPTLQVLVLEACTGMIVGSVAERLGGCGHCCATHVDGKPPSMDIVTSFNLSSSAAAAVSTVRLDQLLQWKQRGAAGLPAEQPGAAAKDAAAPARQSAAAPAGAAAAPPEAAPSTPEGQAAGGQAAAPAENSGAAAKEKPTNGLEVEQEASQARPMEGLEGGGAAADNPVPSVNSTAGTALPEQGIQDEANEGRCKGDGCLHLPSDICPLTS